MKSLKASAAPALNGAMVVPFNTKFTAKQLMAVLRTLKDPGLQVALTTELLFAPSSAFVTTEIPKDDSKKKAVNCFVGFRCHYIQIPALQGLPMKVISAVLGELWRNDLNQSLWALIAQAWTTVRDQVGDVKARRDEFFHILCDHLPIPSPVTYLEDHGWNIKMNDAGVLALERVPNPPMVQSLVDAGLMSPTLSAEELIEFAQGQGYAMDYKPDLNASSATFLGRSTQQKLPAYATFPDPKIRAAKNKKRRFELRTRMASAAANIQADIDNAHMISNDIEALADELDANTGEHDQLYNNVASFAIDNILMPNTEIVNPSSNVASEPMLPHSSTSAAHWNPFILGADPNATLPSFFDEILL